MPDPKPNVGGLPSTCFYAVREIPSHWAWLYSTTLIAGGRAAFRAVYDIVGGPAGEVYGSRGAVDALRYGGNPADLLVFEVGDDGMAVAVKIPVLKGSRGRGTRLCLFSWRVIEDVRN